MLRDKNNAKWKEGRQAGRKEARKGSVPEELEFSTKTDSLGLKEEKRK